MEIRRLSRPSEDTMAVGWVGAPERIEAGVLMRFGEDTSGMGALSSFI